MNTQRLFAIGLGLGFLVSPALGQVPGPANPSRVEERFKPPSTPESTPEIQIPGPEAPMPPDKAASIHLVLKGVVVEGSTVFANGDFAASYAPLLGREISLTQVYGIRDSITAKYRAAGFVLSQAIIPPQRIAGGVIHISIVEGYISKVTFQGDVSEARGLVAAMAHKITQSRPLRVGVLERYVLLIGDLPGIDVRTIIQPSKAVPGAADLVVVLTRDRVSGYASVDNRGSRAIGPVEGLFKVDFNSLLGLNEHTSLLFATTGQLKELQYGALENDWTLNSEGTQLSLNAGYSHTEPGGSIAVLDPLGTGWTGSVALTQPLIRSRSENLHVGLEFGFRNTRTDLLSAKFSDDRVRYIAANLTLDAADTLLGDEMPASNIVLADLSQGLDILGATKTGSPDLSRANGHSDYTKFYAEATRVQVISGPISLMLGTAGQVSSAPLLSAEQFGLGGSRFGRGYEPSELTGDDGLAGSVELRWALPPNIPVLRDPLIYTFYDTGIVWNIDPPLGTPKSQSLSSAGIGIRFDFLRCFSADLDLAKPLTRDIASRGNKNLQPLFGVTAKF